MSDSNLSPNEPTFERVTDLSGESFAVSGAKAVGSGPDEGLELVEDGVAVSTTPLEDGTAPGQGFAARLRIEQFSDVLRSLRDVRQLVQMDALDRVSGQEGDDGVRLARTLKTTLRGVRDAFDELVNSSIGLRGLEVEVIEGLFSASARLQQECTDGLAATVSQNATGTELIATVRESLTGLWSDVRQELPAVDTDQVLSLIDTAQSYQDLVVLYQQLLEQSPAIHAELGENSIASQANMQDGHTLQTYGTETTAARKAGAVLASMVTDGEPRTISIASTAESTFIVIDQGGEKTRFQLSASVESAPIEVTYSAENIGSIAAAREIEYVTQVTAQRGIAFGRFNLDPTGDFLELADCIDSINRARGATLTE